MFEIYDDTIVYVVCPPNFKTGGTELAHQLVKEVNSVGTESHIVYYGKNRKIHDAFYEYVDSYLDIENVKDYKNNIIIFPEIVPFMANKYNQIQKSVWWMSVDNFLENNDIKRIIDKSGYFKSLERLIRGTLQLRYDRAIDTSITHLYQSEYARLFLEENGVYDALPLSDYINDKYTDQNTPPTLKKNIVLYNPKKGIEFTRKLMRRGTGIRWIPLENMSNDEVLSTLLESKVYIDFGNHPGKDRFPREAVSCGCCIITGLAGSARNSLDIPIDDKYKFETDEDNIDAILKLIVYCFDNYNEVQKDFANYRKKVLQERCLFSNEVQKLFKKGD